MELPKCKCGSSTTTIKGAAFGDIERYFDDDGETYSDGTDYVFFKFRKTVRCQNCGKIRRDLELIENRAIRVKPKS